MREVGWGSALAGIALLSLLLFWFVSWSLQVGFAVMLACELGSLNKGGAAIPCVLCWAHAVRCVHIETSRLSPKPLHGIEQRLDWLQLNPPFSS